MSKEKEQKNAQGAAASAPRKGARRPRRTGSGKDGLWSGAHDILGSPELELTSPVSVSELPEDMTPDTPAKPARGRKASKEQQNAAPRRNGKKSPKEKPAGTEAPAKETAVKPQKGGKKSAKAQSAKAQPAAPMPCQTARIETPRLTTKLTA